jgi:hypothetical protein
MSRKGSIRTFRYKTELKNRVLIAAVYAVTQRHLLNLTFIYDDNIFRMPIFSDQMCLCIQHSTAQMLASVYTQFTTIQLRP